MSGQYPLPSGYPPPGATYGDANLPPPPAAGFIELPPPEHALTRPDNMAPAWGVQEPGAGYAPATIPLDGQAAGDLPYGFNPPGAAKAPITQAHPGIDASIDDPILIAEMNQAADMMNRNSIADHPPPAAPQLLPADPPPPAVPSLLPTNPPPAAAVIETPKPKVGNDPDVRPFYLVSEHKEACVLEVRKEKSAPGASVGIGKKKPSPSPGQLWYIGSDGFIHSKLGDLMLEADGNHKSLHTASNTGDARQHWMIDGNKVINATFREECLTIKKGLVKFKDDGDVIAGKYEGKPVQHWKQVYAD